MQRTEDTSGHNFWLGYLHTSSHTRADVIANFVGSVEFTENAKALCRTAGGGSTTGSVHWMISDQLGTPRMIVDASGSLSAVSRHDYLPFGEELGAGNGGRTAAQGYGQSDGVRQQFTGQQRDNETGLDYFNARYFASMQGRFTTPDPLQGSEHVARPQTWNRYSYAVNDPLRLIDPTGQEDEDPQDPKVRTKKTTTVVDVQERTRSGQIVQHAQVTIMCGVRTFGMRKTKKETHNWSCIAFNAHSCHTGLLSPVVENVILFGQ